MSLIKPLRDGLQDHRYDCISSTISTAPELLHVPGMAEREEIERGAKGRTKRHGHSDV